MTGDGSYYSCQRGFRSQLQHGQHNCQRGFRSQLQHGQQATPGVDNGFGQLEQGFSQLKLPAHAARRRCRQEAMPPAGDAASKRCRQQAMPPAGDGEEAASYSTEVEGSVAVAGQKYQRDFAGITLDIHWIISGEEALAKQCRL